MAEPSVITSGAVQANEPADHSAAGLQYQKYQMGLGATGAALGIGRRTVPDPDSLFSHPLSGVQFGSSNSARESVGEGEQAQEEL